MLDLTGNTFYVLPLKLSESVIEDVKSKIRKHNGVAVSRIGMHRANVILTGVRSPQRLERHITSRRGLVVHLDWLNLCLKDNHMVSMDAFQIQLSKLREEVILISSDDEASPSLSRGVSSTAVTSSQSPSPSTSIGTVSSPRQARSLEEIGLAYCRTLSIYSQSRQNTISSQLSDEETTASEDEGMSQELSSLEADKLNIQSQSQSMSQSTSMSMNQSQSMSLSYDSSNSGKKQFKISRGFACQHPVPSHYHNKELVDIFHRMQHFRELDGDTFSAKCYRDAVVALKCYPEPLSNINQVRQIRGVGHKITRMIDDYITHGRILDCEDLKRDPRYRVLDMFYNVHGVGYEVAQRWYRKGYRSLEAVVKGETLTEAQKLGIELYHDFLQKMSRSEVEEIVQTLMNQVNAIAVGYEYTICGSYRRNCTAMGDIDIIISHKNDVHTIGLVRKLLDKLQSDGLITHLLSASVHNSRMVHAPATYNRTDQALVVWQQPGQSIHRRLDLIVTPYHQYYPAILAWTGSKHFEQSLRLFAKKRGFKITHHGIYSRSTGNLIPIHSEHEAFDILGLKYLDPDQRNF